MMMATSLILETLGGTQITQIFTHHCTSRFSLDVLKAYAPGYRHFDQRALILARPDDVVCIVGEVDRAYLQFLARLGLGPKPDHLIELPAKSGDETLAQLLMSSTQVLDTICGLIPENGTVALHPYYASPLEWQCAAEMQKRLGKPVHVLGGKPDIVEDANLKHYVHGKAQELGVPVAPGEVIELHLPSNGTPVDLTPLQKAIGRHIHHTSRVIVRATDLRTKLTRLVVRDGDSLEEAFQNPERRPLSNVYLVQAMFDILSTPNVQLFVKPEQGGISCVSVTDQCLDQDLAHRGNVFPSESWQVSDMLQSAYTLARWLQTEGYTGLVGFDFVEYVHPSTGRREHLLAEINARVNEATYPSFLMEHLNVAQLGRGRPLITAFRSAKVSPTLRTFAELQVACDQILFNPDTGRGAIPYNTGRLPYGRCDVAIFGQSRQEVEDQYEVFSGMI